MRCTADEEKKGKTEKLLSGFASLDEKEQESLLGVLQGLLYAKMKADGEKVKLMEVLK